MIGDLLEFISEQRPRTLADSDEESVTFMDLPREILSIILRHIFSFPNSLLQLNLVKKILSLIL